MEFGNRIREVGVAELFFKMEWGEFGSESCERSAL